jgi:hypothetical protein
VGVAKRPVSALPHSQLVHRWSRDAAWEHLAVSLERVSGKGDPDLYGKVYYDGLSQHIQGECPFYEAAFWYKDKC